MSSKVYYILILALVVVTIVGIALGVNNIRRNNTDVADTAIYVNGERVTSSAVSLHGMIPGGQKKYEFALTADKKAAYHVTLEFRKSGENTLGDYVTARVMLGDQLIEEDQLSQLLLGEAVEFDCNLTRDDTMLCITYDMSSEVGNEAQGAKADFVIFITAQKQ